MHIIYSASLVYLAQAGVGIGLGWSGPVIPKLQDTNQTLLSEIPTREQASWIGSLIYAGAMLGAYIGSYVSNRFGRRSCLVLGSAISTVSFFIMAFSKYIWMIYTCRIIMGVGISTTAIINMVYLGEIASPHSRGIFLTLNTWFITFGNLIMFIIGPFVSFTGTCAVGCIICGMATIGSFLLPESPYFLMLKGEDDKAKNNLLYLGRGDEIEKMKTFNSGTKKSLKSNDWLEIFTIKSNRKALFICLTLLILQQISGLVVVVLFATTIFQMAGSSIEPNIATIIIGLTQIVAGGITPWFIEKSGRRLLLLLSTAFTAVSLTILGAYFYIDRVDHEMATSFRWLPLVTLIVCFLAYDMGYGPIPSALTGEMFTPNVRSTGSALAIIVSWTFGFITSTTFGYLVAAIGTEYTFWVYATSTTCAFLFTLFVLPETKGKSLVEIQEMLAE